MSASHFAKLACWSSSGLPLQTLSGAPRKPRSDKVAVVLLGAGAGRRFGGNKLLAPLLGRRLIDWSLKAALDGALRPVILVVRPDAGIAGLSDEILQVINSSPDRGLGSSVQCALAALEATDVAAAIFAPADQPLLSGAIYDRLHRHFAESGTSAVATYEGKSRNPVLLARCDWPQGVDLHGDEGLSAIVRRGNTALIECGDLGSCADVDSLEDLQQIERLARTNFFH